LSGYYSIVGKDGTSDMALQSYTGIMMIQKGPSSVYSVTAKSGPQTTEGAGTWKDGQFIIGWHALPPSKQVGFSVYVKKGDQLVGYWGSIYSSGGLRPETLTWRAKLEADEDETKEPPKAISGCNCEPKCQCNPCKCGK
jgi:hypothetical protein